MNNIIKLTETDLHEIVKESVAKILKEDYYSYNGEEYAKNLRSQYDNYMTQNEKQSNYKKNIRLFKKAFLRLLKEYTIISVLKRKIPRAKNIFSIKSFLKYVNDFEKDSMYNPIWDKFGGEYGEVADQYLQSNIIKLRQKLGI
jgi:magnesium-transporting ATPase (P-type)